MADGTPFAARIGAIEISATAQVASAADQLRRQGVDVVDLGVGETAEPQKVAGTGQNVVWMDLRVKARVTAERHHPGCPAGRTFFRSLSAGAQQGRQRLPGNHANAGLGLTFSSRSADVSM